MVSRAVDRCASTSDRWNADMRFRINFQVNGVNDNIVIEGDSIEDIRAEAERELKKRNGKDPWSERID